MKQQRYLTLEERKWFAPMVQRLADFMHRCCLQEEPPNTLWHYAQSNFEWADSSLIELGIYRPSPDNPSRASEYNIPLSGVTNYMTERETHSKEVYNMFVAFICNTIDYSLASSLQITRSSFSVDREDYNFMCLLSNLGLAEKSGTHFTWTDEVGPIMTEWLYWSEEKNSEGVIEFVENKSDEQNLNDHLAIAARALSELPEELKNKLKQLRRQFSNDPVVIDRYAMKDRFNQSPGHPFYLSLALSEFEGKSIETLQQHWGGHEMASKPREVSIGLQSYPFPELELSPNIRRLDIVRLMLLLKWRGA